MKSQLLLVSHGYRSEVETGERSECHWSCFYLARDRDDGFPEQEIRLSAFVWVSSSCRGSLAVFKLSPHLVRPLWLICRAQERILGWAGPITICSRPRTRPEAKYIFYIPISLP